jgi:hypothetical protein
LELIGSFNEKESLCGVRERTQGYRAHGMKRILLATIGTMLVSLGQVSAEVLCAKDIQQFPVTGRTRKIVGVRGPQLFTKAPARCPLGYTLIATIPEGALEADSYSGPWTLSGAAGQPSATGAIAFPKALQAAPTQVIMVGMGEASAICTGTAENPTAPPGVLCVYEAFKSNMAADMASRYLFFDPRKGGDAGASKIGTSIVGFRGSPTVSYYAWGTWAVTQP